MSKTTIMIYGTFICLVLLSFAHGEDHWRENLKKRLVRAPEANIPFWQKIFWRRSTTRRTPITTTKGSTTPLIIKTNGPTTASMIEKVTSAAIGSPSSSFTNFQNQALTQTNKYRADHCAPNMILNSTLNSIAQAYANKLAALNIFEHSNNGYGENLYYSSSSQAIDINSVNGSIPVTEWYNEVTLYKWGSPGFSSATGHFTQLVWVNTKQFGIGIACTDKKTRCYTVANYSPPGNFGNSNQYQINVKQRGVCT